MSFAGGFDDGSEYDKQGRRIKRCPECNRARQLSWSDVCRGCKRDWARKQEYFKSDEYKKKAFALKGRYIP